MTTTTTSESLRRPGTDLPFLLGFRNDLAPALAAIWVVAGALFVATGWPAWLVVALWASVTTIMLWPVGRRLQIPYSTYRRPLFVLGVLSMASLPALGIALDLLPPNTKEAASLSRLAALVAAILVLTGFSVLAAARGAIGRPLPMFFRPDILFGDGRVLATGIIALGISFRLLLGGLPPAEPQLPAPNGSWWGILFAIGLGLVQIIPLRGMLKLRMRLARVSLGRWTGWGAVVVRETYLILAVLAVLYGFHNVFMGKTPLVDQTLIGLEADRFAEAGLPGLVSLVLAGLFLVFVRGGYKRRIGDPFLRETRRQTVAKQALFVVGIVWLLYSFGVIMTGRPFLRAPLVNTAPAPLILGLALFVWGVLLVGPIRAWAQRNQRLALIGQMATVLLPAMAPGQRKAVMLRVMDGLAHCSTPDRIAYVSAMLDELGRAPAEVRSLMDALRVECLAELPSDTRRRLMVAMDAAMFGGSPSSRPTVGQQRVLR